MSVVFDEKEYNFTDSIICEIKSDTNLCDVLILIDYYQGKYESKILTIRLKNVKKFIFQRNTIELGNDVFTPITISHISQKTQNNNVELIIESILSYLPGHENDDPIIDCICENVFIEY